MEKDHEILVATAAAGGTKLRASFQRGRASSSIWRCVSPAIDEIAANREILPFVSDDIMETFDDGRSLSTFRLMAEISKVGQVIYLTHHQHLRDIAREACPDVVIRASQTRRFAFMSASSRLRAWCRRSSRNARLRQRSRRPRR